MTPEKLFPIGYVSKKTGLTPHVIRVWERRYGAVAPKRSEANRRGYSPDEIDRLAMMKRAVDGGLRISQIAGLNCNEIKALIANDEKWTWASQVVAPTTHEADYLDNALKSVAEMDQAGLDQAMSAAAVGLSKIALLTEVVGPLMEKIGGFWAEGGFRIVHEHMASAVIQGQLWNLAKQSMASEGAPSMVVATPLGQWCELGALMAAVVAAEGGCNISYLGSNLPAEEIAAAARQTSARAVALSVVFRPDEAWLIGELSKLRKSLPSDLDLYVGGRGVVGYQERFHGLEIHFVTDLKSFTKEISGIIDK